MRKMLSLGCAFALMGLATMGCDPDETEPVDSGMMPTDTGMPPAVDPVGFGMDLGTLSAADFSCVGSRTMPDDSGADTSFTGAVADFFTDDAVEGVTVQFYPDNAVSVDGTCTGTCIEAVSDATGAVSLMDNAGSWYGYRVAAGSGMIPSGAQDYVDVLSFNNEAPDAAGDEGFIAVQASTVATITALLGATVEPGTAFVSGRLYDCNDEAIANATFRMFTSAGEIELGFRPSGPRAFYFNGDSFPSGPQRMTHVDGLFGAANIPVPSDNTVRIEVWGSLADGEAATLLACEEILLMADGLSTLGMYPARSDGPSGCGG